MNFTGATWKVVAWRQSVTDVLGVVKKVMPTGANDVLVVEGSTDSIDQKERLIPFTQASRALT